MTDSISHADDGPGIYERLAPGVLLIRSAGANKDGSIVNETGTGFVISRSGYVLTASHVVPGGVELKSLIVGGSLGPNTEGTKQIYQLELVRRSQKYDAALLQMTRPPHDLRPLPLRKKPAIAGEQLFILGYPLGLADVFFIDGRVSAVNQSDITTNALVNKGNSGGPVVDTGGCVIGIVYSGIESLSNGETVSGIKFAVPLAAIRDLVPGDIDSSPQTSELATVNGGVIHVSDTLSRTQTDHALGDTVRQYQDRIDARPGFVIDEVEAIGKNSLNPPQLQYPSPQVSSDGKYMTLTYSLLSGPIYDQRRGWIDMTIHTRQRPLRKVTGASHASPSCQ